MPKGAAFAELVKRVGTGDLPMTILASAESPVRAEPSNQSLRTAQFLVGTFPGATNRVLRVAERLDLLTRLARPVSPSKCEQCGLETVGSNG
jgi:hypothetical protein